MDDETPADVPVDLDAFEHDSVARKTLKRYGFLCEARHMIGRRFAFWGPVADKETRVPETIYGSVAGLSIRPNADGEELEIIIIPDPIEFDWEQVGCICIGAQLSPTLWRATLSTSERTYEGRLTVY